MKNSLTYPNVAPDLVDQPACDSILSRIDDLAPSDSHIEAIISLLKDGTYHSIIAINAVCGRFQSEAKTNSLVSSLNQAQRSMLLILSEWKGQRFANQV